MKSLCFVTCLTFLVSFSKPVRPLHFFPTSDADTGHINHVLDGQVTEWPAGRFQLNADSTVEYAADNDDRDLYVAMTIPDYGEQMKIMRNGMKLYIDLKGKKKEGRGIEFPVKGEVSNPPLAGDNSGTGNEQQKKLDRKTQRNLVALELVALKLFGFSGTQDEQGLSMPGSVNIAFKWDEADVMHIEYEIPLQLLGESGSLNQKDISIGWQINGFERPQGMHGSGNGGGSGETGGFSRGMRGGGGGGGRGQYGGSRSFGNKTTYSYRKIDPDEMRKEQNFWTKYLINIPTTQKAF